MTNDKTVSEIIGETAANRDRAIAEAEAKRRSMWARIPRLAELDGVLSRTGSRIMAAAAAGGDVAARVAEIERENERLLAERAQLLASRGVAADFDAPQFACAVCGDTGYDGSRVCECVRRKHNAYLYNKSGLGKVLAGQSFDSFELGYYSMAASRAVNGVTERENMQSIVACCKRAARQIGPRCVNLLLMGGTGLGKTHLSSAIAKEVINAGYAVIYDSAQNVFGEYEDNHFGRAKTDVKRFENADLLIIDDLGAEFVSSFSVAAVYNLLNVRTLNGRSTIVSTNLSPKELNRNYQERITSRLFGEFTVLHFFGRDVRMLRVEARGGAAE